MKVNNIESWNNSKIVDYYVNCFERNMTLVFKDFEDFNHKEIFDTLEDRYFKWLEVEVGDDCCEEYILDNLPKIYKDNLVCVVYGEEESEENE